MASRVVVLTSCDRHLDEKDVDEPGEEWTVTFQGPGQARAITRVVDACPECSAPLAEAVAFLTTYGRTGNGTTPKVRRRAPEPEPEPEPDALACPECDYVTDPDRRDLLGGHARRMHQKSLAELMGEPRAFVCEECGASFGRVQGLGVHQARKHRQPE